MYIDADCPYLCNNWRSVAGVELDGGVSLITVVAMVTLGCGARPLTLCLPHPMYQTSKPQTPNGSKRAHASIMFGNPDEVPPHYFLCCGHSLFLCSSQATFPRWARDDATLEKEGKYPSHWWW